MPLFIMDVHVITYFIQSILVKGAPRIVYSHTIATVSAKQAWHVCDKMITWTISSC